ncbi:MAG: nucleotide exchange factor GrpE [Gammaproteobacteria bacterium]|nr:nucleotide exchange factor GrpE [Gammaproteobacteria bacterium]
MAEEPEAVEPAEILPEEEVIDPRDLGLELPEDPSQAIQVLLRTVAALRQEAGSYLDDLQRLAADFDNYRKRMLREQAQNIERAAERVTRNLLPVLDSLDAALAAEPSSPADEKLLDGIRSTRSLLLDILRREGLEPIPSVGMPFDPELHEAASAPPEDEGTLVVTKEMRRGYTLHGRVIRAALVAVDHE